MDKRSSLAASETSYHSFNDVELFEPASPPQKTATASQMELIDTNMSRPPVASHRYSEDSRPATAVPMKRQDSGYESYTTSPRTSMSRSRPSPPPRRRTSLSTSNAATSSSRPRTSRPSTRRSTKSYHHPNSSSVHVVRPLQQSIQPSSYFHFPSPDPEDDKPSSDNNQELNPRRELTPATPPPQLPPQTTHYWTSDRTRRLEYAAIDAASRGLKGWIRRNLLPDCLAARDGGRHIAFDDDTGSVRRYRLELEDDQRNHHHRAHDEKSLVPRRRKTWHFWSGR